MQSPIYQLRINLLAALRATAANPASRMAAHGMRDAVDIVAGMISQLSISFDILGRHNAPSPYVVILWHDIRDDSQYVTCPRGIRRPEGYAASLRPEWGMERRCELKIEKGFIVVYVAHKNLWNAPNIQTVFLTLGGSRPAETASKLTIYKTTGVVMPVPETATSARFDYYNYRGSWMDSDGHIKPLTFFRLAIAHR